MNENEKRLLKALECMHSVFNDPQIVAAVKVAGIDCFPIFAAMEFSSHAIELAMENGK